MISAGVAGFLALAVGGVVGAAQLMSNEVARRADAVAARGPAMDINLVTPEPEAVAPGEQMDVGTLVDGFDAEALREAEQRRQDLYSYDELDAGEPLEAPERAQVRRNRSSESGSVVPLAEVDTRDGRRDSPFRTHSSADAANGKDESTGRRGETHQDPAREGLFF